MRRCVTFGNEDGTALTEFAIMVPGIMIVILYGIFFTDLIEVKLKTLEAARYLTWESVVYRDGASIKQELQDRFRNLQSTDEKPAETLHMIGIENVRITATYDDTLDVDMTGGIPSDGSMSRIGGIDRTINSLLRRMSLPSRGKARSEVTIEVDNKIIPDFEMLNTRIKASENEGAGFSSGFKLKSHNVLVYDTWKAWPNKNRMVGARNGTTANPQQTYAIAERAVVDQVKEIAYFGLPSGRIMGAINRVFNFLGLPSPINASGPDGPTVLRPPTTRNGIKRFSPTYGRNDATRWGHRFSASVFLGDNPNPGIDHSRWTLPYSISTGRYRGKVITWWHQRAGGMVSLGRPWSMNERPLQTKLYDHQYKNDYYLSYQCRGHYYDGYIVPDGEPGDYRNYNGCGDPADRVQRGVQSLLDRFRGGLRLPGF